MIYAHGINIRFPFKFWPHFPSLSSFISYVSFHKEAVCRWVHVWQPLVASQDWQEGLCSMGIAHRKNMSKKDLIGSFVWTGLTVCPGPPGVLRALLAGAQGAQWVELWSLPIPAWTTERLWCEFALRSRLFGEGIPGELKVKIANVHSANNYASLCVRGCFFHTQG